MTSKNEKPKNIKEALGSRLSDAGAPPQTEEEMVTQAEGLDAAEELVTSMMGQDNLCPPSQVPTMETTISSQPPMMQQSTPASNTDPQPADETSTPESLEEEKEEDVEQCIKEITRQEDSNLRRLIDYVMGEEFNQNWILLHLSHISRVPSFIPSPSLWELPDGIDISNLIYDIVTTKGYIENIFPSLKIVLSSSVDNIAWGAGVLVSFAIFDALRILPFANIDRGVNGY